MPDTEDQVQTEEEQDAESSKYWNEAVNARTGEDGEPSEPVEPVQEQASEVQEVDGEPEEPEAESEDTEEQSEDTEEDDPWAGVDEERRKEFEEYKTKAEKYEHETRSNRGRLAALQRKYDELSRKLEETTKKEPAVSEEDAGDSLFRTEKWQKFKDDFGEVADPIETLIRDSYKELHSHLKDTDKVSQALQKRQQEEQYAREAQTLDELKPGWLNFVQENFEDLQNFANSDPALKTMWEANFEEITNAKQAKRLFDLYDLERGVSNGKAKEKSGSDKEPNPKSEPRPLSGKRQQQLKSAATIAPRSHPAPGRRSDDLPAPDAYEDAERFFLQKATTR